MSHKWKRKPIRIQFSAMLHLELACFILQSESYRIFVASVYSIVCECNVESLAKKIFLYIKSGTNCHLQVSCLSRFHKMHAIKVYLLHGCWISTLYLCSDNVGNEITLKSQFIAKLFECDYKAFYVDILWKFLIWILPSEGDIMYWSMRWCYPIETTVDAYSVWLLALGNPLNRKWCGLRMLNSILLYDWEKNGLCMMNLKSNGTQDFST